MLPSEPKIFHGREHELSNILALFRKGIPRIAILGAAGMGKTSLANAVIHHVEISTRYAQYRYLVTCDATGITTQADLAGRIGHHLGMKAGKDLTRFVTEHFSNNPPSLLVLDNFEAVWEPLESRRSIEEFLSLLTDIDHLALIVGSDFSCLR